MQNLSCESCGAPIQIENQFVRSVSCQFCGSAYMVKGDSTLDPSGKTASLANYPSRLNIGARGEIRGRGFTVLGRIRYTYSDGFWDEWQIAWDDNAPPAWLEEDEGYWTLYNKERVRSQIVEFDKVKVGSTIAINKHQVFITEKRYAEIMGSEGQFASVLPIKGKFGYIQGGADNKTISVNYWDDEIEISSGDELEHHELVLQ